MKKISKAEVVAFLIALGFSKAAEWNDEKLNSRLRELPDRVDEEDVPEEHVGTFSKIVEAKGELELVDGVEVEELDERALRALIEENGLDLKVGKKPDLVALRKQVAKALKSKKPAKKVSKKAAPSEGDSDGPVEQNDTPKKIKSVTRKGKKGFPKRELDEFGSVPGSMRSKVFHAISKEFQDQEDIAKAAGLTLRQTRGKLRRMFRAGLAEVKKTVAYRLTPSKK